MGVRMDFLGKGQSQGEVAAMIVSQQRFDPGRMRPFRGKDDRTYIDVYKGTGDRNDLANYVAQPIQANGTLRRDEWNQLDQAIQGISETRLNGIADLREKGLTFNLGNPMGTTVLEYHDMSDAMEAELSMDAVTRSQGDRPVFGSVYLPIPIIHVDYEINLRVLEASRSLGNPLDTTSAERAARKVAARLESMLFTSTTYTFGNGTIYSYLNHPNKNNVTLSVNWNASAKTGAQILADVLAMKQASINDNHYGPWMLYIPTAYETVLDEDYDTTTPQTSIRERLMKIGGISGIKVVDTLTANNVLLVQMTSDVVRLVDGFSLRNVEWQTEGGMVTKYKVMAIQVPQVRADKDGKSGLIHMAA